MKRIAAIALILASVISMSASAAFFGLGGDTKHIKVTKEVMLEGDMNFPTTVIQARDGGYVVVGNIGSSLASAIRIDAKGNVQWRYQMPPGNIGSTFEGAVTLSDDSTLLCGWKGVPKPTVLMPGGSEIVGVLTHIDKAGKVLSDRIIIPQEPGVFGGSYLKSCLPWGNGFALVGTTLRVSGPPQPPRKTEHFYWLFALDAAGNVKWEKLIPTTYGLPSHSGYVDPEQNFHINDLIKINQTGELSGNETIPDYQTPHEYQVPQISAERDGHWKVGQRIVLPANSFRTELRPPPVSNMAEYSLPDHSLVRFGATYKGNVYYAGVSGA